MAKCNKCKKGQGILFVMGMGMVCRKCYSKNLREVRRLIKKFGQ